MSSEVRVYVILGSHACRAGTLMLEHKAIPFRTVTVPRGLHPLATKLLGFPGRTVPAIKVDGRKVQTNPDIARFLDELKPEPRLLPEDPECRREVEEAVAWGQDTFQMAARRAIFAAALQGRAGLVNDGNDGGLGPLLSRSRRWRRVGARIAGRAMFNVNEQTEARILASVPGLLDQADAWIEAGILNGEQLNAADFAIAPNIALLTYRSDTRDELAGRPSLTLADRLLPEPAVATG